MGPKCTARGQVPGMCCVMMVAKKEVAKAVSSVLTLPSR